MRTMGEAIRKSNAKKQSSIDILEDTLARRQPLLDILLLDRTRSTAQTGKPLAKTHNILWATDSYVKLGKNYAPQKEIQPEQITSKNGKLIQPRAAKSREEQKERVKAKAEVFTPLKIVKQMNQLADEALKAKIKENESKRAKKTSKIDGQQEKWQEYVSTLKLEITCGEAPFIVSRYDPVANTGKLVPLKNRVGFLDLKLQAVSENCSDKDEWLKWAKVAYQSSYGFEWQGDNLLLARENLLMTFVDYYNAKFPKDKINLTRAPSAEKLETLKEIAEIVSWNIFQMDGLKFVVPMSCKDEVVKSKRPIQDALLDSLAPSYEEHEETYPCQGCAKNEPLRHTGHYATIMNWKTGKLEKFIDSISQVNTRTTNQPTTPCNTQDDQDYLANFQ